MKLSQLEEELAELAQLIINEKISIKYLNAIKGCRILIKEFQESRKGVDNRIFYILNELELCLFQRWIDGGMSDKLFAFKMKDFIEKERSNNDLDKKEAK